MLMPHGEPEEMCTLMNPWNWQTPNSAARRELESIDYEKASHFIFENNQPSVADGRQLQGVINLLDNHEHDGGFVTVDKFYQEFPSVFSITEPKGRHTKPSHSFHPKSDVFSRARRVAMQAGSVVVWDQQMAHGSFPNYSDRPRMAQFIKMYPAHTVSEARYTRRARSLQARMMWCLTKGFQMTDIGRIVFGVRAWEALHPRHPCFAVVQKAKGLGVGVEEDADGDVTMMPAVAAAAADEVVAAAAGDACAESAVAETEAVTRKKRKPRLQ
eukprot:NODE_500_length_1428_cov_105.705611_g466_i0.p1 GENE.NODE_500_length_1428_cov_105.705611_g466_i0~~NODE_500_length_1428_cov_105.705611_g466_i0.p1  ORF type:complete len:271 (+),score=41.81 NODE_500_length_1428_cov_105.705611_g466_i0:477-1289(+)